MFKFWGKDTYYTRNNKINLAVDVPEFLPYFDKVKMLVGVTKQKKNAKKIHLVELSVMRKRKHHFNDNSKYH